VFVRVISMYNGSHVYFIILVHICFRENIMWIARNDVAFANS
jgi:hypothetical protein